MLEAYQWPAGHVITNTVYDSIVFCGYLPPYCGGLMVHFSPNVNRIIVLQNTHIIIETHVSRLLEVLETK